MDDEVPQAGVAGGVGVRVRELIREVCRQPEVTIMKGHLSRDHVHLFVSIPPQVTIRRPVQWLQGRSPHHRWAEFVHLRKQFWGWHVWARGYLCRRSGDVTDAVVAKYIEERNQDKDHDFKVENDG